MPAVEAKSRNETVPSGLCISIEQGIPQASPLSPLLAHIKVEDLDRELTRRGHHFVRYADDCNMYVNSRHAGERVMESVRKFVEGPPNLIAMVDNSTVDPPWKRKFFEFSFTYN